MDAKLVIRLILAGILPIFVSCGGAGNSASDSYADTLSLSHAKYLSIIDHDGFTEARIFNPWDSSRILHSYILIPDSIEMPRSLPQGTVVRTPLRNAVVYSSVHAGLITELGAIDAIKGMCDVDYVYQSGLVRRLADGEIADCGKYMSPDIEKIISLNPDAILLSPFEDSGDHGKLGQLGVPIIECADYMELSPLGRAEWMKFYGALFGKSDEALEMFNLTEHEYNLLCNSIDSLSSRPKVLLDRPYGATWFVPVAGSTTSTLIHDAGGDNLFDGYPGNGYAALSGEEVLYKGQDADVWLIRYTGANDLSLDELAGENPLFTQFRAFKEGRVYGCNTSKVNYYEETPFHPQFLLIDLMVILNSTNVDFRGELRYFSHLNR